MSPPLIDTRQLRHVLVLAKHRNFHRAAEALFITQPALTKSIRNLEDSLGVNLFDRQPNDVSPTAHCDVLLESAQQVFVELEEIQHKLDSMSNLQRGELKIGSGPIIAESLLADTLSRLVRDNPALNVEITIDSWHVLARMLRQGELHLMIADAEELLGQTDLSIEMLPPTQSIFACRAGHPLAERGAITPEDLLDYPIATPALPQRYINWFMENAPQSIEPADYYQRVCRITCESYATLRGIAKNTDYLTSGPEALFKEDIDNGRMIMLELAGFSEISTCAGAVYLKNRTLPPSGRALLDLLPKT